MRNDRKVYLPCCIVLIACCSQILAESSMLTVDYKSLVSRADLTYEKPVVRAEEGLPVGNGTMGSLVWTSPTALKFLINRVDVYSMNSYSRSFNRRDWDYSYGCGHVNIDFVDFGPDVFEDDKCLQHLSVYDALAMVKGKDVTTRVLAWHRKDVMAVEVTDNRPEPQIINTNLRMMRHKAKSFPGQSAEYIERQNSVVMTKHHKATSKFHFRNGRIILTQKFEEGDYYCGSALAIAVIGRESRAKLANVAEARLAAKAGNGRFTILMATAASFDPEEDLVAAAIEKLDAATAKGFEGLLEDNKQWWHDFWSKAFIHLSRSDGSAELVEQHYTYFLYIMGSSSRGKYPPRYGAMIWSTEGDYRHWGTQHWWYNLRAYYRALPAANRPELMDPMFNMYFGMYESSATAARQQWGSKGIFIPETTSFNGLEVLPEDIAAEMRDLYLLRKPWDQRSQKFIDFAFSKHPHNGRWNWRSYGQWVDGHWIYPDKGQGPYGHCVHLLAATARAAYLFWLGYEYSMDQQWLRDVAYPMIKGAAEFYRNFPNVKKGRDGKYHIYYVNNNEPFRGYRQDTMWEMAGMHGIFPTAIKASEILDLDADLRPMWQEVYDNLAPMPIRGRYMEGPVRYTSWYPAAHYDLVTLESDAESIRMTNAAFHPEGVGPNTTAHVLSATPAAAARLGRKKDFKTLVVNQIKVIDDNRGFVATEQTGFTSVLANRMTLREGVNDLGAQRLGLSAWAIQQALCQSVPPKTTGDNVIRVFEACPQEWDAEFTLLCKGAFLVTSSQREGKIEFVEIKSQAGGKCNVRNPWGEKGVDVYRNGRKPMTYIGSIVEFQADKDDTFVIVPKGHKPKQLRRTVNTETK
jgi:hypothetical protein